MASATCLLASPAGAHGFGQRYDLPLPLSFYLYGTAAVVVVSFIVVGFFIRQSSHARTYPSFNLLVHPVGRLIAHPGVVLALRLAALLLFMVTVTAGFIGDQNPYRNIAPTMVWIVVWVGLAYVSAFVGDVWKLINPWRTIFDGAEWLYRRSVAGRDRFRRLNYPEALGVWPAVILLLAFSWFELVYPAPADPATIAAAAIGYSILTLAGMAAFGSEAWLRHGEFFSVLFGTLARFAPIESDTAHPQQLILRPFGAGLIDGRPASPSVIAFVLLILSTVLFDGFLNSPEWTRLENSAVALLRDLGPLGLIAIRSIGLVAFWLLFLGAYVAVCAVMSAAAGRRSTKQIAQDFVFTLIPIATGYHLAHYLVFLLIQGQYVIPLASDPFGFGWNVFGTAGYRVDIAIVDARFAWYAAVIAIVLGHVIAVYLAHVKAMWVFTPRWAALRSQVPLTALMVVYTFVSLSILAEPIVERRMPAQPSARADTDIAIPDDAVLPEHGSGRLQPVGPGKSAKVKLTYRVLGSAFHDGTRTNAVDLLYATMFAYRWSVRGEASVARYDPVIDAATATMRSQLAGLQVTGDDTASKSFRIGGVNFLRELFTVDVYTAAAPENPERDLAAAAPWSTLPWHVIVLMEEAVERGWAAFSRSEAERRNIAWLDLVRSEPLNARLASLVETFERESFRPAALSSLVSVEEARARWAALATFSKAHGHFLVTNGPYQLKSWSTEKVTLSAFRDLTYPLGVGSYDAYAVPRKGYITKVEQEKDRLKIFGDIETVVKFARNYRIERGPIQSVSGDVLKRASPECRYVVRNDAGRVVLTGTAALADDLTFKIDFSGRLAAGSYTVAALIAVNENVMNADIRQIPITITSAP